MAANPALSVQSNAIEPETYFHPLPHMSTPINPKPRLNDVFQDGAATHSSGTGRTIMNLGFCPIDCGNN